MGANLLPVPGRTLRRSRRIDRVNQLTQAAKSAANRRENQPAQVETIASIVFFSWRNALDNFARAQDVPEAIVQIASASFDNERLRRITKRFCHPARRMKIL